jgi:4-hydroxy-tetrahydrodipicolinate synthase
MTGQDRLIQGIIPPLLTPFRDWKTLDVAGLENLVERLLAGGVHGLFLLGTCGEGVSIDTVMKREIIDRVSRQIAGRVPFLTAISDTSIVESLRLADYAAEKGSTGLVVSPPYYHPITQDDLKRYLFRVADHVPLPTLLYNIPSHTKTCLELDTLAAALEHPKFVGLKDSSGYMDYFAKAAQLMNRRKDLTLLIGPEDLLVPAMKLGAQGGIPGGANLLPKLFVNTYNAVIRGEESLVETLERRLMNLDTLYGGFYGATFLGNMKCALSILGICAGEFAEPLHALEAERIPHITAQLDKLGINVHTLE